MAEKKDLIQYGAMGAIVLFALVFLVSGESGTPSRNLGQAGTGMETQLSSDSAYIELVTSFKEEMKEMKEERSLYKDDFEQLKKNFEQHQEQAGKVFEKVIQKLDVLTDEVKRLSEANPPAATKPEKEPGY